MSAGILSFLVLRMCEAYPCADESLDARYTSVAPIFQALSCLAVASQLRESALRNKEYKPCKAGTYSIHGSLEPEGEKEL
jgi:hypothetical protein